MSTFWSIWPRTGQPHYAVFQAAPPIETRAGTRLRVDLAFRTEFPHAILGRFRLSVTNRPVPFFELRLRHLKADRERNGLARLGAAYSLLGDWASAAAVHERAAARHDGSARDGFLLALAHHHLGRALKARSECDRSLARLRTDQDEDETHDVAAEALTTIRGLNIRQAEALLPCIASRQVVLSGYLLVWDSPSRATVAGGLMVSPSFVPVPPSIRGRSDH
jgi:hypothetical protein